MINGMYVSGFMVRALKNVEQHPLAYGLFPSIEAAQAWADNMTIESVVEVVYAPVWSRG
jgi:hypothetical protein